MGCPKHASQQVSFLVRNPQNANLTLLSRRVFDARRWSLDCNESYMIHCTRVVTDPPMIIYGQYFLIEIGKTLPFYWAIPPFPFQILFSRRYVYKTKVTKNTYTGQKRKISVFLSNFFVIWLIIIDVLLPWIWGQKPGWVDERGTANRKVVFFLYMNDFEATRRLLEAIKTAGDSWDLPLQDPKTSSTFVDL